MHALKALVAMTTLTTVPMKVRSKGIPSLFYNMEAGGGSQTTGPGLAGQPDPGLVVGLLEPDGLREHQA